MTNLTDTTTCPFRCCDAADCDICRNPVTGEFEVEAEDTYPPEDFYVGYDYDGYAIGG